MNTTIIDILNERYGDPTIVPGAELVEYRWNEHSEPLSCLLYKATDHNIVSEDNLNDLRPVYGDIQGGFLLLDSIRLAMLSGPPVYGLYSLNELRNQPEVRDAAGLDPDIHFFMDASNVWFYGIKEDELYVYDSETGELARLGAFDKALRELLQQWEQATPP